MQSNLSTLADLEHLVNLGDEITKLSTVNTVTKYLPEDDRPGIMTLLLARQFKAQAWVQDRVGTLSMDLQNVEVAQVGLPSLLALSVAQAKLHRNDDEELLGRTMQGRSSIVDGGLPMIMARMIGDEMEPTIRVKLFNVRI